MGFCRSIKFCLRSATFETRHFPSFPLDRARRLYAIDRAVDALDLVDDEGRGGAQHDECLAGRAVVETYNHGRVGNDDGIAALLGSNLEPAFDRRHGHCAIG